jgi:hypothetical protein
LCWLYWKNFSCQHWMFFPLFTLCNAFAKPLTMESNAQMRKWWCHDHKTWTSDNWKCVVWSDEPSFLLFLTSGRIYVWRASKEAWFQQWNMGEVLWWFGQQYHHILLVQLLPFIAELLLGSTWRGWVIRCIPCSRYFWTLKQFSKMTAPIHTAGTVQSCLEEHDGDLQHLPWPAQSPDLNVSEPL